METGMFRWSSLQVTDPKVLWPNLRITVDTPEDFELATRIFEELYQYDRIFSLADIVNLCRQKPELLKINAEIEQKPALPIKVKSELGK